jgi:hypothetical protein
MTDNGDETKELTTEQIQQLFMDKVNQQVEECQREVSDILIKHGCRFQVTTIIRDGKIQSQVQIVKKN